MLLCIFLLLSLLGASLARAGALPPSSEHAATARWMVQNMNWGYLSTTSSRSKASTQGDAFGNPYSFADSSNGVPYFYASDLDASMVDLFAAAHPSPRASFALSEASLSLPNGSAAIPACQIGSGTFGDPENPPCARLVLSGTVVKLSGTPEEAVGKAALFERHPSFRHMPKDHGFYVAKLEVDGVWLIDFYGGAAIIPLKEYFAANASVVHRPALRAEHLATRQAPAPVAFASVRPPWFWEKAATARWMAKSLSWGVLSTTSTRSDGTTVGAPFGNPYSFADASHGVPYFYASLLDASMIDLFIATHASPRATFALSEASLTGPEARRSCKIGTYLGDPQNPPCARLVLSGTVVKVSGTPEEAVAKAALFERHPSFKNYPASHDFFVAKLEVDGVWLIDIYGGAADITPKDYFAADNTSARTLMI